jgi:hypothetical protein
MSKLRLWNRGAIAALVAVAAAPLGCYVEERPVVVEAPPQPPPPEPPPQQTVLVEEGYDGDVVVDDFREPLGNYGVWVYEPAYGYVWQPAADMAGPGFMPYASDGRWVVNDEGDWVFMSRYDAQWGWATYHYGRWVWSDVYGWVWIPGRAWAPAWVDWRYGGGYVGWVPMGPPGVVVVEHHWVFVEQGHICSANVYEHRIPEERAHDAYVAASPTIGTHGASHWRAGPPAADLRGAGVELASGQVARPGAGYVHTQSRAVHEAAADRRATGKVPMTAQVREGQVAPVDPGRRPGAQQQSYPQSQSQSQPQYYPQSQSRSQSSSQPQYYPSSQQAGRSSSSPPSAPYPQGQVSRPSPPPMPAPAPAPRPASRPTSRPSSPPSHSGGHRR